jgi:hypothetical protein
MMLSSKREAILQTVKRVFKTDRLNDKDIGDLSEVGRVVGKSWQQLKLEDINVLYSLYFFSPQGFHHYLPAYMSFALSQLEKLNPMTLQGLLRDLGSFDAVKIPSTDVKSLFTKPQRKVVLEFLLEADYLFQCINPKANEMSPKMTVRWEQTNTELQALLDEAVAFWSA